MCLGWVWHPTHFKVVSSLELRERTCWHPRISSPTWVGVAPRVVNQQPYPHWKGGTVYDPICVILWTKLQYLPRLRRYKRLCRAQGVPTCKNMHRKSDTTRYLARPTVVGRHLACLILWTGNAVCDVSLGTSPEATIPVLIPT